MVILQTFIIITFIQFKKKKKTTRQTAKLHKMLIKNISAKLPTRDKDCR